MEQEVYWRLGVFFAILLAMALWETVLPKRTWRLPRMRRWTHHILLSALNTVVVRVVIPLTAAAYALTLQGSHVGILNWLPLPNWVAVVVGVLVLDLAIYFQHVWFHKLDFFWRFHRMHHTDLDFDVTTGIRFHPIEIVISMLIKFAVITVLGPPAIAVVVFEILLNATSMFNHGNIRIPQSVDRILRLFVVTPDMHRVHHSDIRRETDSNFGFNLPWWDRLFGTYRDQPEKGHTGMSIGLPIFRFERELRIDRLISQPFRDPGREQ